MAVAPSTTALATLEEAKAYVWREQDHTTDEQDLLCLILNGVSDAVNQYLGGVFKQTYTEKYDGGVEWIALRHRPVLSVSSVKELSFDLVEDEDYLVYLEEGRIRRLPQLSYWPPAYPKQYQSKWAPYPQAVEVAYVAGWAEQERDADGNLIAVNYQPGGEGIRQAVLVWCYELWHAGPSTFADLASERGILLRPEGIPPHVRRLLAPYVQPVAVIGP